jgi:Mrp family chromosome partitioning ATPase
MFFWHTPKPASFAKIRMQILSRWLLNKGNHCSVIAFTANFPREGVSTVITGLARSFSATDTGKVLLLDASGKRSRKPRPLDVTEMEDFSDLSDYVSKDKKLKFDKIKLTNISHNTFGLGDEAYDIDFPELNLGVDDDGTMPDKSPDQDMSTLQTRKLLLRLRKDYNLILVDSGTLNNSGGTFWLVNSDVNILVIDCSSTTRESLEFQQHQSENSGISIDGSILNKRVFPIPSYLYWLVK